MSELINKLKEFLFDNKISNIPEIKFLQESDIILTINRGFTVLYRTKPKNPTLFLSKWLSRESLSKELAQTYKDNKIRRENLEIKYYQQNKQKYQLEQRKKQKIKERKEDEDNLIREINTCTDFWLGFNHICQRLKVLTKSTGCYIGIYDQKRRPVKEDDDIDGHLDPSGTKVLRYISWNDDHNFLEGKCLEPNEGVTFDLITSKISSNIQDNQQEKNEEQKKEEKKEENKNNIDENIKTLMIEDVVNDNRIKFFREPRLGCYFALDLTYKTSLSYNSLLSAIQCTKNYETAKEEQETRKKEWSEKQEEIRTQIKELKEAKIKEEEAKKIAEENEIKAKLTADMAAENDPNKLQEEKKEGNGQSPNTQVAVFSKKDNIQDLVESIENLEKQLTEWQEEPVKLQEYEKEEKNIYMCLDTLGQDRIFSEEEINYIKKVGINIRESLEKLEQNLLEKDRDIRIKFLDNETNLKKDEQYSDEKFEESTSNYIAQYFSSEEFKLKNITEEKEKSIEGDLEKLRYFKSLFLEGDCLDILLTFQEFEFVEHLQIFQNLLYFAKMNPLDINENKTNKLEWKKARKFWKDLFPYLIEYNPIGPKPEQVKEIYKLNKIKENLESCLKKRDEIKSYSQMLVMLLDFILHIIKVRHDNIIYRLCKVAVFKDRREKMIKENANIDEERQKIIDAAKALNPNVRIPGEKKEEEKEEEKKEEENLENKEITEENNNKENNNKENKEEIKEEHKEEENKEILTNTNNENKEIEGEQNEEDQDEIDSNKLAEELQKFDEEHPKQEIPPDVDYDIDNDYDIDQSEKDTEVSNALQAANTVVVMDKEKEKEKNKTNVGQNIPNNNGQPINP